MTRLPALLGSIAVLLGSLVACGGSDLVLPTEPGPGDITPFSGDNQQGLAGAELSQPLVVKVLDRRGQPIANQQVAFGLATEVPGAEITPATAETGDDGTAEARWVLGRVSGSQTAVARVVGVDGLEVRFTAVVRPAGASHIEAVSGSNQSAPVGSELADPLVVRVVDGFGNPVDGISVRWDADEGSVSPGESVTGQDGQASTSWTLGSAAGSQSATARNSDLNGSPVDFTATARAGGADRLVRVSGDDQTGRPGSNLADPLVVRLLDNAGNGVPNRAVSWVVASGGGEVDPGTSTTDENGRATTEWTLGSGEGSNTLNAVVSGIGVVGFSATAIAGGGGGGGGIATRLAFRVQPSRSAERQRIAPAVEVAVLDQSGNRVTDREFEVKLELMRDGRQGKLKGDRDQRTQGGVARFSDLEVDRNGVYRLRASTDGLPSVDSDRFEVRKD
ncbi:MAG TPA: Ig-like domain-containing protein [Gemmatimonadales bacterium]|nr:Ig-like domain-containing protein [Gemmatimonadales bacterium]